MQAMAIWSIPRHDCHVVYPSHKLLSPIQAKYMNYCNWQTQHKLMFILRCSFSFSNSCMCKSHIWNKDKAPRLPLITVPRRQGITSSLIFFKSVGRVATFFDSSTMLSVMQKISAASSLSSPANEQSLHQQIHYQPSHRKLCLIDTNLKVESQSTENIPKTVIHFCKVIAYISKAKQISPGILDW